MKVLLDTDIGSDIDDAVCLSYLLAEPRCELLGVTTVTGQPQVRAALVDAVCRAQGRDDVVIHAGTESALLGPTPQPAVPQSAILDRFDHRPAREFAPNTAIDFLRDTIAGAPGEVTLLSIGPMTNVALLFATYPDVASQLAGLVLMGGTFDNAAVGYGPTEWNVSCDPEAAAVVYRAAVVSHRSIGLNVSTRCRMATADASARFANPVVAAATEVWGAHRADIVFHDPLAGVAIFRPDVCRWAEGRVDVELVSRRYRGATAFEPVPGGPHTVAVDVDPESFLGAYFSVF